MVKFDDNDYLAPSIQSLNDLESFIELDSISFLDDTDAKIEGFPFVNDLKLEIVHLKSIVVRSHYSELKKSDCAKSLSVIISSLEKCHFIPPKKMANLVIDTLVELVDCMFQLYSTQLSALDQFSHNLTFDKDTSSIPWPFTMNTIELCVVAIGELYSIYDMIKHEPMPVSVDKVVNVFIEKLESLLEQRYTILDKTAIYAEDLLKIETFRFKSFV